MQIHGDTFERTPPSSFRSPVALKTLGRNELVGLFVTYDFEKKRNVSLLEIMKLLNWRKLLSTDRAIRDLFLRRSSCLFVCISVFLKKKKKNRDIYLKYFF